MALRVDNYLDESDRDNAFERTKVMTLIEIAETNNSQSIERLKEIQKLYVIINEKNEIIYYSRFPIPYCLNDFKNYFIQSVF